VVVGRCLRVNINELINYSFIILYKENNYLLKKATNENEILSHLYCFVAPLIIHLIRTERLKFDCINITYSRKKKKSLIMIEIRDYFYHL